MPRNRTNTLNRSPAFLYGLIGVLILVCLATGCGVSNGPGQNNAAAEIPPTKSDSSSSIDTTSSGGTNGLTVISGLQGKVGVMKSAVGRLINAEVGMQLSEEDSLKTEPNASATVTFFDGSSIEIWGNTDIKIVDLGVNQAAGTTTILLRQEIGETISRVKKLIDPVSKYEIETPAAVAAVRGSQMFVNVAASGITQVQNIEGKISVIARGVELKIPEGGTSTVKPGEPPSPVVYSALNAFRVGNGNPNGTWSYGWMPADFSIFNRYTYHDTRVFNSYTAPDLFNWYERLGSDHTPCMWINTGGTAYGAPTGWLSLHPGPKKEPSVLRWTAPVAVDVHIVGEFLPGDRGNMAVAIRHSSREIWAATDSGSFDLRAKVAVGDTIDFMVYGGYNYGNTPINVNISYGD
jgi:hypothetical protein